MGFLVGTASLTDKMLIHCGRFYRPTARPQRRAQRRHGLAPAFTNRRLATYELPFG